jgi:cyclopropane fatty-acyl-phospholipid synthase-like methyltransferase
LLENPERERGWTYDDPVVLESQGQASRLIVRGIETLASQHPDISLTLKQPGSFLDVGTGVGWLAIEAAQSWTAWRVVGIDSWKAALDLARKNVAQSPVADRVEFRFQRIEQLDDDASFALAWLPGPFIAAEVMPVAIERVYHALKPGGWLIVGLYPPPPDELGQVLTKLRIVRSGGHPWTTNEVEEQLRAVGFDSIESFSPMPPVLFVAGRRPLRSMLRVSAGLGR